MPIFHLDIRVSNKFSLPRVLCVASTGKNAPPASIVFDRFHVSKHLNEAVDQVRRQENKSLKKQGDTRLIGTKQMLVVQP